MLSFIGRRSNLALAGFGRFGLFLSDTARALPDAGTWGRVLAVQMRRGGLLCSAQERDREQVEGATQSSNYWSSTTNQNNPTNAWNVNFNNGNTNNNNKTNSLYVRAVRAGS